MNMNPNDRKWPDGSPFREGQSPTEFQQAWYEHNLAVYNQRQQPKKKHTGRNIFIAVLVLAFLGVAGCLAIVGVVGNEVGNEIDKVHTVVYKVSGTSKVASLTYTTDGSATMEQETSAKLPWTKTLQIKGAVNIYQLMAQNGIGQTGKVTCSITVDDDVVKTATATGEGAIASCNDY